MHASAEAPSTASKEATAAVIWDVPIPPVANPPTRQGEWRDEELRDWPPYEWPPEPVRPEEPSRKVVWQIRFLVGAAAIALAAFFVWLLQPEKRGDAWLFWPLVAGFLYRGLWWTAEWLNYTRPKFEPVATPQREWTVDVLTTACPGEPRGMIIRTLLAMKRMTYPHRDYLCDEGDDPVLRAFCREHGIIHVTRAIKKDAKAGNINNALAQCTGEITVILDPDHEPAPYMLDRVLGYFEDPTVGFVQSVQAYRNQKDSFVADGAAKQTYLFYGPMMIGMHGYGTTQAIGANCVFRRAALDSIGGHAAGLAEDMHTTMRLYAKRWRSVYIPEILTRGLVPSTLTSYCKQQMKWACGSLELLLHEYPKLFRGMTFWQRVHYFMAPLYFLRGLFGLVNLLVPIACLTLGGVALRMDLLGFLAMYLPALLLAGVIRQKTQHWTIEKSERGAHLVGGLLGTGCWWVFLRGALCAFCRIRLPYIPTPKESEAEDCWGLVVPNLVAAAASIGAVIYGLQRDWTPFNLLMAAFALFNSAQLTFVSLVGQQRTMQRIAYGLCRHDWIGLIYRPFQLARFHLQCTILRWMRERSITVVVFFALLTAAFAWWVQRPGVDEKFVGAKETGGFYVGVSFPEADRGEFPATFGEKAAQLGTNLRLLPLRQKWSAGAAAPFPLEPMREARLRGAVPLITWEPTVRGFPGVEGDEDLRRDRRVCEAILRGFFDEYLHACAVKLRDFGDPVLMRFAPNADHPGTAWSAAGGNSAEDYVNAWKYVVAAFSEAGAANVGWVWQAATPAGMDTHFPGVATVDWIGVSTLNTGRLGRGRWREFDEIYRPFHEKVKATSLPVMVTRFGSAEAGGDRAAWLHRAFADIAGQFTEIKGLVLSSGNDGWFGDEAPIVQRALRAGLARPELCALPPPPVQPTEQALWVERKREAHRSPAITRDEGGFSLRVDGEPFYVQGLAYNPGHDWRNGHVPLTRRELTADLARVRSLGANTIRRYGSGWFDRNILHVAREQGLKVMFGFWFGQQVDYRTDAEKRKAYAAEVEQMVRAWRDDPTILAWSLGNEVWGLLKHRYAQPYLTEVRQAHVDFVEDLARRIRELDPDRPIFTAHEHSPHLAGTLADFARGAPSLDFTAVNSYYEHRISSLAKTAATFDPDRPYLVSEFGPDGYWETNGTRRNRQGLLLEPLSYEKARSFERGWLAHTLSHRGANIGGVAYCWRNRLEATATWFGISDHEGRLKPEARALQRLWTGQSVAAGPQILGLYAPDVALPGSEIECRVDLRSAGGWMRYTWQLSTDDATFKPVMTLTTETPTARLRLPRKAGAYRLYVNATDGTASDEANVPITGGPVPQVPLERLTPQKPDALFTMRKRRE